MAYTADDMVIAASVIGKIGKKLNNQYRYGEFDEIEKAEHYNKGIETIDYIESHNLNFNQGNAIKYITRCEHKGNKKKDLEKALYYIKRELEKCKE